jgi:hypothetical protein
MTALITAVTGTDAGSGRGTDLAWNTWRQHRLAIVVLLAAFVASAIMLLITGLPTHAAHDRYLIYHCLTVRNHPICSRLFDRMRSSTWVLGYLPWLVGVFLGAPVAAREFETGTYRFAMSQGVSVRRQLVSKMIVLGTIVVAGSVPLGLLATWCQDPFLLIGRSPLAGISRWDPGYFHRTAVTLPAWALLALGVGTLAGVAIKRTVPAMAATVVVLAAAAILGSGSGLLGNGPWVFVQQLPSKGWLTEHLLDVAPAKMRAAALIWFRGDFNSVTLYGHITGSHPSAPVYRSLYCPSDWAGPHGSVQVTCWLTRTGRRLSSQAAQAEINRIPKAILYRAGDRAWLSAHRVSYWIGYQPGSRYWVFQGIIAAILLAVAALAGFIAVRLVGRRR